MPSIITGQMVPFSQPNVDTDVIMPKRFLKTITRKGLAHGALADLRFDETGAIRPEFVLNQAAYRDASILVVGSNFGCGSSREHAVWGLMQLGIKAIIGTDFGGIFYDNARKNGLALPIVSAGVRDELLALLSRGAVEVMVDITSLTLEFDGQSAPFEMDAGTQAALIAESDETLDTLKLADKIRAFETKRFEEVRVRVAH